MDINITIGVVGGGVEGLAVVEYFYFHGYRQIVLFDENNKAEFALPDGVKAVLGVGAFEQTVECDILFRSPGVRLDKLGKARANGVKITSTTQYFLENCPCPVIGVTGTKGKGTTSTLIYEILKSGGRDVYLGGNIGDSPLKFLDKLKADSLAVLELSSFQLQDLALSPHVAVVLMTTSEHLDYHADREEYWNAKLPILKFQNVDDFCVLNKDYEYYDEFAGIGAGEKFMVSRKDGGVRKGAFVDRGAYYYVDEISDGGEPEYICGTAEAGLLGEHNRENILAAICVCRKLGVSAKIIRDVVREFKGLEHRLEFVRSVRGVNFYNDSFSTTPETSLAAVYAFEGPVLLIAGGSEKNADYREWAEGLQKCTNLKDVFLIGVTADRMEAELTGALERGKYEFPVTVYRCGDLEEAIEMAYERALPGDNIVMSPAAASFDMFKNYKYRGSTFKEIVSDL